MLLFIHTGIVWLFLKVGKLADSSRKEKSMKNYDELKTTEERDARSVGGVVFALVVFLGFCVFCWYSR